MELLNTIIPLISILGGGIGVFLTLKATKKKAKVEADKAEFDLRKEIEEYYAEKLKDAYSTISRQDAIIRDLREFKESIQNTVHEFNLNISTFEKFITKAYNCEYHSKDKPCPILNSYLETQKTK